MPLVLYCLPSHQFPSHGIRDFFFKKRQYLYSDWFGWTQDLCLRSALSNHVIVYKISSFGLGDGLGLKGWSVEFFYES